MFSYNRISTFLTKLLAFTTKYAPRAHSLRNDFLINISGRAKKSNLPEYQYARMTSERHIRLLRLLPDDSCLRCELLPRALDLAPSFQAISYTLGNPTKTHSLILGNCSPLITDSAYTVLRKFASTDQNKLLWIDAICINQHDDEEKSQQVRLMTEIYSTASCVNIWLGSSPEACLAHTFFTQLCIQNSQKTAD